MTINTNDLKKKIIYRSNYRGTKEMDTLVGSFTRKYINNLNNNELICLSDLLEIDDENLYRLNMGKSLTIKIKENKVTELFKTYIYNKN